MRVERIRSANIGVALIVFLLVTCMPPNIALAKRSQASRPSDEQVRARIESLIKQMTLEEKVGQLTQVAGALIPGARPEEALRKGGAGSVLWLSDPAKINALQRIAVEQSRLHIPVLFGLDVIHGYSTIFPVPLAMAASWDPATVERAQAIAAREASAAGIMWTFTPMVDIARDARWGRIVEGAGEDPYLGSAMARAQVRGLQGPYLGSPGGMLACAKHFAAYGAAIGGRDYDQVSVSDEELWNIYFPPFRAAADAGVGTFMSAYMDLNGVPAAGNRWLLRDVLRDTWHYRGFVVSDALAVGSLITHGFAADAPDAAYRAINAGLDMDMASGTYAANLANLVRAGRVPEAQVDAAVRRILEIKIRLGLFEHPYVNESATAGVFATPEHRQFARVAAQRSMVLLRNEQGMLPLKKNSASTIAVIGPLGNSKSDLEGSWGIFGAESKAVTIVDGIRNKFGTAAKVEYAPGPDMKRMFPSFFDAFTNSHPKPDQTPADADAAFAKAVDTAKRADVVVMALGELANMSGEAASRSSLALPGRQQQLLEAIVATGKPIVLVLVNGRPLDISWATERVPAILEAWYPGVEGGNAIADVLFGDANPGGKLPMSWPRNVGQVPIFYAHNRSHQPESDPMFKSRYWDLPSSPLYPFGYGLSYSKFAYSNLRVNKPEWKVGEALEASVDVENTGAVAGDAVVQLYIHQRSGSASRPVRELKGFERLTLAPGEKKTARFKLGKDELTYWSAAEKSWVLEPATFDLWAGGDSTASLSTTFRVIR
jgi:beta-glucosidase